MYCHAATKSVAFEQQVLESAGVAARSIVRSEFALNNVDVFPNFLGDDLVRYDANFDRDLGYFVEKIRVSP